MSPDELVQEIFRLQDERDPDSDPGDLTIEIQDDMMLAVVRQPSHQRDGEPFADYIARAQGMPGDNIQQALEKYLQEVIDGSR